MDSLEEKLDSVVDTVKAAMAEFIRSVANKDPPQVVFPTELFQRPIQMVLDTQMEVSQLNNQLSSEV